MRPRYLKLIECRGEGRIRDQKGGVGSKPIVLGQDFGFYSREMESSWEDLSICF